jgi:hypothetical protein
MTENHPHHSERRMHHCTLESSIVGSGTSIPPTHLPAHAGRRALPCFPGTLAQAAFRVAIAAPLLLALLAAPAMAQGGLLIFPMRIVFDGGKNVRELTLVNNGKDTMRYAISFTQMRMNDDGGFENITTPDSGQRFADKYLRLFPKHVVLAPQEGQSVKVELVRAGELEPGEYRSHLFFRTEEKYTPLGDQHAPGDSAALSVQVKVKGGMTIAAIVRIGANDAKVELSDLSLSLQDSLPPTVRVAFRRSGAMSVYGDIFADYLAPDGGVTRVGSAQGVAVYHPNAVRRSTMQLQQPATVDYRRGILRLTYCLPSADGAKPLASAQLKLGDK